MGVRGPGRGRAGTVGACRAPGWDLPGPGLTPERKGTSHHCLVNSMRHLVPSGQLGWGLGGSGCPAQHGSSGRTRRRTRGEGRGGGPCPSWPQSCPAPSLWPAPGPAPNAQCDQSGGSSGSVGPRPGAQAGAWPGPWDGVGPRGQQGACREHPVDSLEGKSNRHVKRPVEARRVAGPP